MIRTRVYSVCLKNFSKFLYFLPAQAIDNARLFRVVLDELDDIFINIVNLRFLPLSMTQEPHIAILFFRQGCQTLLGLLRLYLMKNL